MQTKPAGPLTMLALSQLSELVAIQNQQIADAARGADGIEGDGWQLDVVRGQWVKPDGPQPGGKNVQTADAPGAA